MLSVPQVLNQNFVNIKKETQAVELLLGETSLLLSLGQAPTPVKLGSEMLF